EARIDIAVVRFPYISNFTDLAALEATADVRVRYLRSADALGSPDLIVLPGSKNTLHDLHWLRESGLGAAIQEHAARNVPVMGICGGYQMLGTSLVDETGSEGGGSMQGLGLLPVSTEFAASKRRTRTAAQVLDCSGPLGALSGAALEGYEIHMGRTEREEGARALVRLEDGTLDGCQQGNIYGCYLHGFFDSASCRKALLTALCASKGIELQTHDFDLAAYRDEQYDILATGLRKHLNMDLIYQIIDGAS
ncbi:MAG: cobyric acid synthase CobQ, partial [Coriobacteriales bacterium]|nr:cobyric acid synthase CobQ [Coriobacteriales bacterium]